MLDKKKKDRIIEKYKIHKNDTGSPEVQIALLSAEIKELTDHLKTHKKDYSSRRGLIKKVSQRRKLLHYLQREDSDSYEKLTRQLRIRKRSEDTLAKEDEVAAAAADRESAEEEKGKSKEKKA
ncbi:30S ribosomal protein S15 [bacterium]|jgi:small subunit ribosomal protein S15|nr:30S ribosomal protein S15 [bacterium]|tara:strand:+ start:49188 stop:49556 length:369 start_codon:yes stop_codon:yes gene_type:complete